MEEVGTVGSREKLLAFAFNYLEKAIAELIQEGKLYLDPDEFGEDHLDMFRKILIGEQRE